MNTSTGDHGAPYTVAIVCMGPSHRDYLSECISGSGRFTVADETWAVNAMAGIIQHDRAFIMDDLAYFAKQAREAPHLAGYKDWLHKHPGPLYTSRASVEFPGSVDYPIKDVLADLRYSYFNTTVAYAVGFAIHLKVRHLKLYGMDFTDRENRAFSEAGRACVEYWLAVAIQRGIKVMIARNSSLCDQATGRPLYGYSNPPDKSCLPETT